LDTIPVVVDRQRALELYREYKKHAHYSRPIDRECQRAYQLLAKGCKVEMLHNGGATMHNGGTAPRSRGWRQGGGMQQSANVIVFEAGTFPVPNGYRRWRGEALVPTPPLNLRRARGLANYHVLWDAEWTRIAPSDPFLLRRIGRADMWLVVAMWELTPVEKAALATRLTT